MHAVRLAWMASRWLTENRRRRLVREAFRRLEREAFSRACSPRSQPHNDRLVMFVTVVPVALTNSLLSLKKSDVTREGSHERRGEGVPAGRLRSEEFQILLGYQKPVEHLIAAPLQVEPLTGKGVARMGDARVPDFHNAADRLA